MLNRKREQKEAVRRQRENEKISQALRDAAEKGEWDVVTQMVHLHGKDGDIINAPALTDNGMSGATALYLAAQKGHIETVNALLRAPSIKLNDANYGDEMNTPLLAAAKFGHTKVVIALAAHPKINPNIKGVTIVVSPLMYAVYHCPDAIPALLASKGREVIDVNAVDSDRRTALMHAILCSVGSRDTVPDAVTWLLKVSDVNAVDKDGMTPLMYAAQKGNLRIVTALLAAGANAELFSYKKGQTAEDIAVECKHPEIAAFLREHAAPKPEENKPEEKVVATVAETAAKNFKTRLTGKSFLEFFHKSKPDVEDAKPASAPASSLTNK